MFYFFKTGRFMSCMTQMVFLELRICNWRVFESLLVVLWLGFRRTVLSFMWRSVCFWISVCACVISWMSRIQNSKCKNELSLRLFLLGPVPRKSSSLTGLDWCIAKTIKCSTSTQLSSQLLSSKQLNVIFNSN